MIMSRDIAFDDISINLKGIHVSLKW